MECQHCQFNKKLLLPLDEEELYNTIINFSSICCPYSDILNVIDSISVNFNYDQKTHSFVANCDEDTKALNKAKDEIINHLKNLKVKYKENPLSIEIL